MEDRFIVLSSHLPPLVNQSFDFTVVEDSLVDEIAQGGDHLVHHLLDGVGHGLRGGCGRGEEW